MPVVGRRRIEAHPFLYRVQLGLHWRLLSCVTKSALGEYDTTALGSDDV